MPSNESEEQWPKVSVTEFRRNFGTKTGHVEVVSYGKTLGYWASMEYLRAAYPNEEEIAEMSLREDDLSGHDQRIDKINNS